MRFTGLSEFLVYGLLFAAIIGFNILKQVLGARRNQKSGQTRPARPASEPSSQPELMETHWGRTVEPQPEPVALPVSVLPLEVVSARERDDLRQARLAAARQAQAAQQAALSGGRRRLAPGANCAMALC